MKFYACTEILENGACADWVELSSVWLLPAGSGVKIGMAFFSLSVLAFGVRLLSRTFLNR